MLDALNAFSAINREAFFHNTKILCPSISTYINNCYSSATDLYIQGAWSKKVRWGNNTRWPHSNGNICIQKNTPLFAWLSKKSNEYKSISASKQVPFADDLNGVGTEESIKKRWSLLKEEGKNIFYNVNASKTYLIPKEQFKDKTK